MRWNAGEDVGSMGGVHFSLQLSFVVFGRYVWGGSLSRYLTVRLLYTRFLSIVFQEPGSSRSSVC